VREKILPALATGHVVICDRFLDSTTVYQGVARHIPSDDTARINAFAVGGCLPDITFLLDLDHKTSIFRMQAANRKPDRIERETPEFFEDVRRGYLKVAKETPKRVLLIDASRSVEEIAGEVLAKTIAEINK